MNDEIRMTSGGNDECRMSNDELPDGWLRAPFSAVTVNPVQRVPGEKEQITYIDIGSVDRITKQVVEPQAMLGKDAPSRARKVIQAGDVLVSTVRPNLNAVALVGSQYNEQFASTGFDVLRSPVVDPRWLFYSVRTPEFLDRMSELVQGALYPAVRSKDIRSFVISIAPLAEQKRIADKLEAVLTRVDACRARLDRVPALLKRFRQSVLHAATSGGLTAEWREETNTTEGTEKPLGEVIKVSSGKALTAKNMAAGGSIPVFGGNGINGYHDRGNVVEETLVIGRVGYYCGCVHMTPQVAWVTDNALIVRHDATESSKRYLFYALQALDLRTNDAATAQPVISGQKIYSLLLSLPTLPEQQEIVRRVESLFAIADRIEARLAVARKTVDRLTPSVLAKAFRGELVPQDPADEPASALLERLQDQPPAKPAKAKRTNRR